MVAATQWFERTLDDSANKRLTIPQAFLAVDAILLIWNNIMNGIVVYENRIHKTYYGGTSVYGNRIHHYGRSKVEVIDRKFTKLSAFILWKPVKKKGKDGRQGKRFNRKNFE